MNHSTPFRRAAMLDLPLGNLIRFGDHLLVGHPAIDAQHKAMYQLGIGVYEDWRDGGSLDVLRPAVDKLSDLVHSHFALEERVLHGIGYDDLEGHTREHQEMRDELCIVHDRFHSVAAQCRGNPSMPPGEAILRFVLGITVGHVGNSDMRYYRALTQHGSTAIRASASRGDFSSGGATTEPLPG